MTIVAVRYCYALAPVRPSCDHKATLPIIETEEYPAPVGIAPSGTLFEITVAWGAAFPNI
jgi:hypothetical protein